MTIAVQPWSTPVARASTPPLLDYEFADAQRIANAPGVDPTDALSSLATAAARQQPPTNPGGTQHVVVEGWGIDQNSDPDPNSTITPTKTENWLYPDGRFRTRAHYGEPLKADGRGIPVDGTLDRSTTFFNEETEPAGSRDPRFLTDMPDTVDGVRDRLLDRIDCLERDRGQERSICLVSQIRGLALTYVIPPQTMANIWRVLSEEEGIRSLGKVKDRAGRDALALSFIWDGAPEYRIVILADPDTGAYLGSERILIKQHADSPVKPPAIEDFVAIVESRTTR